LVFDTDVHAGNGTMDIFNREPRVLFIDIHQDPSTIYPGRGFLNEIGEKQGRGYSVNVPLPPGAGDNEFDLVLHRVFMPLVEQFEPEVIIRNGGPDSHFDDGLGSLNLTFKAFHDIGKSVKEAAQDIGASIINMSCSGYNPKTVSDGMYAILSGIMGKKLDVKENNQPPHINSKKRVVEKMIEELASFLREYWSI